MGLEQSYVPMFSDDDAACTNSYLRVNCREPHTHSRRKWQVTPVFLPGKSRGQRSLAGYSPWGVNESDTTERLNTHTHNHTHT